MVPRDLRYAKTHEWVRVDGDIAVVGITDHAQHELGDIVHIELPGVGDAVSAGAAFGVVESVKAASDVYAPVSGEVVEVNEALEGTPETVNRDAYGDGWLIKVRMSDPTELDRLLGPVEYEALLPH